MPVWFPKREYRQLPLWKIEEVREEEYLYDQLEILSTEIIPRSWFSVK